MGTSVIVNSLKAGNTKEANDSLSLAVGFGLACGLLQLVLLNVRPWPLNFGGLPGQMVREAVTTPLPPSAGVLNQHHHSYRDPRESDPPCSSIHEDPGAGGPSRACHACLPGMFRHQLPNPWVLHCFGCSPWRVGAGRRLGARGPGVGDPLLLTRAAATFRPRCWPRRMPTCRARLSWSLVSSS